MRTPLAWLAAATLLVACAKKSDESGPPTSAAEQAAPEAPATPPAAAEPQGGLPGEAPAEAPMPTSAEKRPPGKKDGLAEDDEEAAKFQTVEQAQAALTRAKVELDTLLSPAGKAVALSSDDARCDRACKALSSMRRAADGVCRLAGEDDRRCGDARSTVSENEKRVSVCSCATEPG